MDIPVSSIDAIVEAAPPLGQLSSAPPHFLVTDNLTLQTASDQSAPKMKRRRRLLLSLNRISSSPSLAKMRPYRSSNRASMSCVSLSSPFASYSPYEQRSGGNSDTDLSQHYSTAPTSVANSPGPSSPGPDSPLGFDFRPRTALAKESYGSIGLPMRMAMPISPALSETVEEVQEDYFSCPEVVETKPTRPNFHFWNDMPAEIQVQILSLLTPREIVKCSAISKAWHNICFDGQLWQKLDTTSYYQTVPADALIKIISRAGPFVRDLNLRGCVQLRNKWSVANLAQLCENLQNFSLEGCLIDTANVNDFLSRNNHLVHINLSGLGTVGDKAMKVIARQCPKLQHLNVSWCGSVSTNGIRHVVDSCLDLNDLRAGEVRGWDDVEICTKIFERNTLERLVLTNCDSLTDESLSALMVGVDGEMNYLTGRISCPPRKLRHLDLTRCRNLTDESVQLLAYNVPHLEGLQLAKCANITDSSLTQVLPTLQNLTHLDLEELEGITNASLQAFANDSPSVATLKHLSVSYCEQVGDMGLLPVLRKCAALKEVDMDNTNVTDLVLIEAAARLAAANRRAALLSTEGQGTVVSPLKLVVYDCRHITWNGILEILYRNAEIQASTLSYQHSIISLKAYYTWQPTVNEHFKRLMVMHNFDRAIRLQEKWKAFMMAGEEAVSNSHGHNRSNLAGVSRRRRRRVNEAWDAMWDDQNPPEGAAAAAGAWVSGGRRRARSGPGGAGGSCSIM
jgi:F-box and leucine-rich repeat protein 2/20